ncbi:histidinol-phosphatase [Microtetraspora sp. NBRC 13810]|uniref:histidinol-phosphatase n=1 Tax=Microtetraspora sp. NBRC 13810 TaxID=3030990 RepID=UPI0024A252A8|nr:histidinol-phosphatase [Microtetraspora sp. NBRC 13810]GLW06318.1 histidinol-phosphatase [Microtetraspora sp. NBRC 13810]
MTGYSDDLRLAHAMADAADELTMRRFRASDLRIDTKPDLTPVSDADRAAEEAIRAILGRERPGDAVVGEEYGWTGQGATRSWIVDPIDGTKNYVRGVPVWATLIALMDEGRVVAGVVSAPALGRRWWAARDQGAWAGRGPGDASPIHVSAVRRLEDASFSFSDLEEWEKAGRLDLVLDLTRACWRTRGYGDFWSHVMVAEGSVDLSAEPDLSPWDMAALTVIVEEAGGRCSDLAGAPGIGASLVCTNGPLHEEVLKRLGGAL